MKDWSEYMKRRRAAAKSRGVCSTCTCRPAKTGRWTCQRCLDEAASRRRESYAAFRVNPPKANSCGVCGCAGHNKRSCRWKAVYQ